MSDLPPRRAGCSRGRARLRAVSALRRDPLQHDAPSAGLGALSAGTTMPRRSPAVPQAAMLTHFTRASGGRSALDNLVAILRDGVIRGSLRMIRGRSPVVSLFDAPLTELGHLLSPRNRRRYQPFGIAFDKRYAFRCGARPVIYLPWSEARQILPPADHWRVVSIDLDAAAPVDWSYEREWRVAGDLRLPRNLAAGGGAVALVDRWRDVDEVFDLFDGKPPCAGVLPISE